MSVALRAGLSGTARALTVTAILLSATVLLAGWGLHLDAVLYPWPRTPAMVPPTALCLIMLGLAALAMASPTPLRRRAVRALSYAVMILVGIVMAVQLSLDLGATRPGSLSFIDDRHRMSVGAAAGLVVLALCALRAEGEMPVPSDLTFALTACGNTAMAVILTVHAFDAHSVFALPGLAAMSAFAATAMMLLFGALMLLLIAGQPSPVPDDSDLSRG